MKSYFSKPIFALFAIALILSAASFAHAAVNMYLQITDKDGKVTTAPIGFDGTFKSAALKAGVYSWSWGVNQPSRVNKIEAIVVKQQAIAPRDLATGQASGKRQYQPVIIRKRIDKTSPLLCKLGNLTIDADCDGIIGTVDFKDASGKTVPVSSWDLGTIKK